MRRPSTSPQPPVRRGLVMTAMLVLLLIAVVVWAVPILAVPPSSQSDDTGSCVRCCIARMINGQVSLSSAPQDDAATTIAGWADAEAVLRGLQAAGYIREIPTAPAGCVFGWDVAVFSSDER